MRPSTLPHRRPLSIVVVVLVAMAMVLAGCSSGSSSTPGSGGGVRTLSAAEAVPQLAGRTVIDVRTPAEYAAGHLAGAINMNLDGADFAQRLAALDKAAPYVVYCQSGRRSALAADEMAKAGFKDVIDAGGITALAAAGARMQ